MNERIVITFDTETTGFHAKARLVEVAAIRWRDGQELGRFHSLVNPGEPMPEGATRVNGITDEMLAGQPSASDVLALFHEFVDGADLVAHNASFDTRIIAYEYEVSPAALKPLASRTICTLDLSRRYLRLPNHKLVTVAQHFKLLDGPQEHRAMSDALLVGGVYWKLREHVAAQRGAVAL